jgi:16S rRNA (guanine966-N2)-methyltransferase
MGANRVRIIGGAWRSRLVSFVPVEGLRPSADPVRETLFNWLGQSLTDCVCLDLFAGSGVLGFEAASRGAKKVVLVEARRDVAAVLRENAKQLGAAQVEVVHGDALEFVRRDVGAYDVVFLDPPFSKDLIPAILTLLIPRLAPAARVYVERGSRIEVDGPWRELRRGKAGQVHYQLLALEAPCRTW